MFCRTLLIIICVLLPVIGVADVLKLKASAPKSYVVKKGDTLWDISARFLNKPWLWPKLWRLNPEIKNPHLIYPGDKLSIVYDANGEPMLVKGKPTVKWSPKIRKDVKQKNPVSLMPLAKLAPYLTYEQALQTEVLDALPYVLGGEENYKSTADGIKLYVKGDLVVGNNYALYEQREPLIDPVTKEILAYEAELLGTAKAIRTGDIKNNVPATIYVKNVRREIRAGAKVLPITQQDLMPAYFNMKSANANIKGHILKATHDGREFAKFEVVILNKGERDEVSIGDIVSITRQSPAVVETPDGPKYKEDSSKLNRLTNGMASEIGFKMPIESIGHMMIFKTYPKVSMAIILTTEKSIKIMDSFTAPN